MPELAEEEAPIVSMDGNDVQLSLRLLITSRWSTLYDRNKKKESNVEVPVADE
jgi:hypothetical protein